MQKRCKTNKKPIKKQGDQKKNSFFTYASSYLPLYKTYSPHLKNLLTQLKKKFLTPPLT